MYSDRQTIFPEEPAHGSANEDQRLAPPPLAESGERLPIVRLALLARLRGETGDGELGLDEGGHGRRLWLRQRAEAEKLQARKTLEIPVERNQPTSGGDRESGEVGITPEAVKHGIAEREPGKMQIGVRRLGKKTDFRRGEIATLDVPRFRMRQRSAQHARLGAEAQKSEHGDLPICRTSIKGQGPADYARAAGGAPWAKAPHL